MERLHEFFAVTTTSVYRVRDERVSGCPEVLKIALHGESAIPLGGRLDGRGFGGTFVGVMLSGVLLYDDDRNPILPPIERPTPPNLVNTFYWGGQTSPLVALFFTESEALVCHSVDEKQSMDPRWSRRTEATLKAIGIDHPVFILSTSLEAIAR